MGVSYNPQIVTNGLVCNFDIANQKSYSPNVHPKPLDLYSWINTPTGYNCALSVDTTTRSPVGNLNRPLMMVITGNDPYIITYNTAPWNISPAVSGQTWTMSVWVKASVATTAQLFMMEANSSGSYLAAGAATITVTTNWTRQSYSNTLSNASTAYVQCRLDGTDTSGTGITLWWDGLQLERSASMTTFNPNTNTNNVLVTDTSNTANNGTLTNNPIYSTAGYLTYTAASSHYISLASVSNLQFLGVLPCSFEAWVYPTTNPGANSWTGIICRESNPGLGRDGYNLLFYGSATTTTSFAIERISAGVSVSYFHYLDSSVTLNNWHHIVATFDGYNLILYRNGVAVGSVVQSTSITNTTAVVKIGVLSGTQYFNGRISATRIYNIALTADNVKQNFNAIRGRYGI
jgi:hypothetical protein